jgi:hypothetical protein
VPDELDLLRNLGHDLVEPDEDSEERAREFLQQRIDAARADRRAERVRRPRLRWSLLIASAMLLAGSALGFGLGSALTPSGSAGGSFVGFGFLPAHGWNVMQSGTVGETGKATAIAANVPLEPRDDFEGAPLATIRLLPANSVVIFVTFSPRGDPAKDGAHPVREPPLRLEDADQLPPSYHVARYRLRAGIGGYNVDARIYFGENAPSTRALAAAQNQINRLVVANDRVTIRVQPLIVSAAGRDATVSGSVENGRAGEDVKLQAKDCGRDFFRVVGGAVTREGGRWSTVYWQQNITTTLRAVWGDATSAEVLVRMRAFVYLRKRGAGRFEVRAWGRSAWRKRVFIQSFDRRLGTWRAVKSVVLTEDDVGQSALGTFTVALPKGTPIRAVFPRSQAGPCYLAGTSPQLRT